MTDITELTISIGATIATDEMLADVESMSAISAGLEIVQLQLAIADATLTDASRAMTQVGWARAAMDDAWVATNTAKEVSDYLGGQLVIASENYAQAERNAQALALGVDAIASFLLGKSLAITGDAFGPAGAMLAALFPGLVRGHFEGEQEPIGARDVEMPEWLNAGSVDPDVVATLRRLVMTGDIFATGLGPVPAEVAAQFERMGVTGVALSSHLLMLYAAQAGMLTETNVTVSKTASYTRDGAAVNSTLQRIAAIPDPALRPDGAQIRVDEIHEGGSVRYEVFIAGTEDFNPISKTTPFDLTSNVAGVGGLPPASYRAVQLVMEQAGITDQSAVSFVGYSQGGLIASMLAASGNYDTRGLTTIGGPSGQIIIPPGVPALLIEHFEDPIPALGGTQANTDAVIVQRHAFSDEYPPDSTLPLPGHQLQYYLETAEMIDDAESSLLSDTVDQLNAFSGGDQVISTWYTAERVP